MKNMAKPGTQGQSFSTQLIGQAGVWTVAAQLALRGHNVLFPGVDHGYDVQLANGLRVQVKAGSLRFSHPAYRDGVYTFDFRKFNWDSPTKRMRSRREYEKVADFFVLWGIDENRFWIVPTSVAQGAIWFRRSTPLPIGKTFKQASARYVQYENRWDLLDVNRTVESLIESAPETVRQEKL